MIPIQGTERIAPACRGLLIALALPIFGCGTSSSNCGIRPNRELLRTTFAHIAPGEAFSSPFQVPGDLESTQPDHPPGMFSFSATATWTPADHSMLLAISDHPCSVDDLIAGSCSLARDTGRAGYASFFPFSGRPGTYIVYVVNLGTEPESGDVQVVAQGTEPLGCFSGGLP